MPQLTGIWPLVLILAVVFIIFYFLMVRPLRQREKKHDEMVETLKKGDKEVSYVCGISNFEEKASYPAVKLDSIYHELVKLSTELLTEAGYLNPAAKADLMLPLARILRMPFEEIMKGNFGK